MSCVSYYCTDLPGNDYYGVVTGNFIENCSGSLIARITAGYLIKLVFVKQIQSI